VRVAVTAQFESPFAPANNTASMLFFNDGPRRATDFASFGGNAMR
jgi:hypothetical protein